MDYSDKYGLGYQLSDNSCGVLFNDQTRLLLLADGENLEYIERNGAEAFHTLHQHPDTLTKKVRVCVFEGNGAEAFHTLHQHPDTLRKKVRVCVFEGNDAEAFHTLHQHPDTLTKKVRVSVSV